VPWIEVRIYATDTTVPDVGRINEELRVKISEFYFISACAQDGDGEEHNGIKEE
jgi:hypothetical protein